MHKLLMVLPTQFETERLMLRCYQPGDGAWYYQVSQRNRAHLAVYEAENSINLIKTSEDAEALVREYAVSWNSRSYFMFAVLLKDSSDFAAQVYVGPVNWDLPEFEIGYISDVDHEGKGYVSEAVSAALEFIFIHLKAHRARLECDDTNLRSWRVAERCGFVREGHIRENKKHPNGSISGTLYYGLIKSEWDAHKGNR
jgi:ribosomal-protein-alanine N-acetyltransferase